MAETSEAAVVVPERLELRSETCLVAPWSAATAALEQLAVSEATGAAIAEAAKRAVMKVSLNCMVKIEKDGSKRHKELRRLRLDIEM